MSYRRLIRCRSFAQFIWLRDNQRIRLVNRAIVARINHDCTPRFW